MQPMQTRAIAVSSSGDIAVSNVEIVELVTTGNSTITRTLPLATGSNAVIVEKKFDSGTGMVVVAAAGSPADSIDGDTSYDLVNQYQYVRLIDSAAGVWSVNGGN